jgi:hypothetical protein
LLRTRFLEDFHSWTALTLEVGSARVTSVGDLRVRFVVEPYGSWSSNRARAGFSTTGANMVSRTKERARDLLLVPALPALATPSIC